MIRFLLFLILVSLITPPTVVMANDNMIQVVVKYDLVQPVFKEKCGLCHSGSTMPGKDWTNYEDAFKYKESIKTRVFKKEMPPLGMPELTDRERTMIEVWVILGGVK